MIKKLEVEFQSGIDSKNLLDRKYSLTHSDETGQRYLFIRTEFAEDKFNKLKDEVTGEWTKIDSQYELHISCTLYSKYSSLTINQRYEKFKYHMPRAITAILNGDREYLTKNNLLNSNVYVYFIDNATSNKKHYGKVTEYIKNL